MFLKPKRLPYSILELTQMRKDIESFDSLRIKSKLNSEYNQYSNIIDVQQKVLSYMLEKNEAVLKH